MKTLNEQIERLRELVRKCYGVVASKNGIVPEVGERNMENLPDAIASTHDTLEELTITQNGEYLPQEGVDGFSKVTAEFDTSSLPKVKLASSFRVTNACINDNGRWNGENLIDTSECTNFQDTFNGCSSLLEIDASWDTKKVITIRTCFAGCTNLKRINGIDKWDTSKVATFSGIFEYCNALKELDLTSWSVESFTGGWAMQRMFVGTQLETIVGGRTIEDVISNNITCLRGLVYTPSGFSFPSNLDRASLRAFINGLADLTGQTAQTLTLGATLIAKLTEEDIAIATSKNWTIV